MESKDLWKSFVDYGFGEPTGVSFPAASSGYLSYFADWQPLDHATIAFGYGVSVTALQLARAYSIFANEGKLLPLSLLKREEVPESRQVMSPATAKSVLKMMEQVVGPGGTATDAAIKGYRVAGKTGTARKSMAGGYMQDTYISVFAGVAPVSNPRLVMAVMIDDPKRNGYHGGQVAAPVFSEVLGHALRLMNISPDDLPAIQQMAKSQENKV